MSRQKPEWLRMVFAINLVVFSLILYRHPKKMRGLGRASQSTREIKALRLLLEIVHPRSTSCRHPQRKKHSIQALAGKNPNLYYGFLEFFGFKTGATQCIYSTQYTTVFTVSLSTVSVSSVSECRVCCPSFHIESTTEVFEGMAYRVEVMDVPLAQVMDVPLRPFKVIIALRSVLHMTDPCRHELLCKCRSIPVPDSRG